MVWTPKERAEKNRKDGEKNEQDFIDQACGRCVEVAAQEPQVVIGGEKAFTFDEVFDSHTPQVEVYKKTAQPLLDSFFEVCQISQLLSSPLRSLQLLVSSPPPPPPLLLLLMLLTPLQGINVTIFAYGQTGQGLLCCSCCSYLCLFSSSPPLLLLLFSYSSSPTPLLLLLISYSLIDHHHSHLLRSSFSSRASLVPSVFRRLGQDFHHGHQQPGRVRGRGERWDHST
eukprot:755713-Hanusia_phi.AAC.1